jgi:hypothetical protein
MVCSISSKLTEMHELPRWWTGNQPVASHVEVEIDRKSGWIYGEFRLQMGSKNATQFEFVIISLDIQYLLESWRSDANGLPEFTICLHKATLAKLMLHISFQKFTRHKSVLHLQLKWRLNHSFSLYQWIITNKPKVPHTQNTDKSYFSYHHKPGNVDRAQRFMSRRTRSSRDDKASENEPKRVRRERLKRENGGEQTEDSGREEWW